MKKLIGISAIIIGTALAYCGNNNHRGDDNTMSDSTMNSTTDSSYQNSNVSPTNPSNMRTDTIAPGDSMNMHRMDTPAHIR